VLLTLPDKDLPYLLGLTTRSRDNVSKSVDQVSLRIVRVADCHAVVRKHLVSSRRGLNDHASILRGLASATNGAAFESAGRDRRLSEGAFRPTCQKPHA